jgi:hypothetical protein
MTGSFTMNTTLNSKLKKALFRIALFSLLVSAASPCLGQNNGDQRSYVGTEACRKCHEEEYTSFIMYAKKSRSFESIQRLRTRLTDEEVERCFSCHTTGYGKPGGFISSKKTPQLMNAGCEVCHGPGSVHVKTASVADIKNHLTKQDCQVCHISERVKAFRYKPLIHGGAH